MTAPDTGPPEQTALDDLRSIRERLAGGTPLWLLVVGLPQGRRRPVLDLLRPFLGGQSAYGWSYVGPPANWRSSEETLAVVDLALAERRP